MPWGKSSKGIFNLTLSQALSHAQLQPDLDALGLAQNFTDVFEANGMHVRAMDLLYQFSPLSLSCLSALESCNIRALNNLRDILYSTFLLQVSRELGAQVTQYFGSSTCNPYPVQFQLFL